jgi:hypothetical protein
LRSTTYTEIRANYPTLPSTTNDDDLEQTFGTEFSLSEPCMLNNIWYYSPPSVSPAALPTICAIWNIHTQQVVSGHGIGKLVV